MSQKDIGDFNYELYLKIEKLKIFFKRNDSLREEIRTLREIYREKKALKEYFFNKKRDD